eukprot:scaffold7304_cov177-Skeletonema_marinoi.AAC.8
MAVCFQCSQEKSRDAFSKAQLRKTGATRRCKQCIEADDLVEEARKTNKLLGKHNAKVTKNLGRTSSYQPPPPPPPPSPLSDTKKNSSPAGDYSSSEVYNEKRNTIRCWVGWIQQSRIGIKTLGGF